MSYRILLVDDSVITRKMQGRMIEMTQLPTSHVFEARNGIEALDVLSKEEVDLVLCDVNMPEMSGPELVAHLAETSQIERVPVVIITSDRTSARTESLLAQGVRAYLTKPVTPEKLRDVFEEIFGVTAFAA